MTFPYFDMSTDAPRAGSPGGPEDRTGPGDEATHVVVVGPAGMAVGRAGDEGGQQSPVTSLVEEPAMVMRVGSMVKQLLEEVRSAPMDEAGRARLAAIHEASIAELQKGLAPELADELRRLSLPFSDDGVPTEAELRVAQAQLVGWLEGLFHGIQTALFAQQMAARAQFEEMRRRALPPGAAEPVRPGQSTGQYL